MKARPVDEVGTHKAIKPQPWDQPLFDASSVPERQFHQMDLETFARQPDTWWHSSDESDVEKLRERYDDGVENGDDWRLDKGFHIGTYRSAQDRGTQPHGFRQWHHPVRLDPSQMWNNPEDPAADEGDDWEPEHHGSYYTNAVEDVGSVSAVVSSPHDVTTHADTVREALARGGIPTGIAEYQATTPGAGALRRHDYRPAKEYDGTFDEFVRREDDPLLHSRARQDSMTAYDRDLNAERVTATAVAPEHRAAQAAQFEADLKARDTLTNPRLRGR